ncbi:MAG: hypothetical protein ACNYWU_04580 [Desulfobacterales bacterium]
MKIKMTEDKKGSIDGVTVNSYLAGNEYDIAESLASVFVKMNVAKEVINIPEITIETPEKPIKLETASLKTKRRGRPKGSKNKRG